MYQEFNKYGYKPNRKKLSFCTAKIGSFFISEAKSILKTWGKEVGVTNDKAKDILKIEFRDHKQTIIDMGYSLIERGYVPDRNVKRK